MKSDLKIFVSRTDRLGDVMMALSTLQYLREAFPAAAIDFCCSPAFRGLLGPFLAKRNISWVEKPQWTSAKYDAALFLNYDSKFLLEAWKARVRVRAGNKSRLASHLFLNVSLRQHRSLAEKSEGLYTLDLARAFVARLQGAAILPTVRPLCLEGDSASMTAAIRALGELGVSENQRFAILHPGMGGGSALNLSEEKYLEVVDTLTGPLSFPVVLSEGPSPEDRRLVEALKAKRSGLAVLRGLDLSVVREVFRLAKLVVAPSTGPLHVAHYVGTRTIGLYSPVRSQRPERWAPWGGAGQAKTLVPEVKCPGTHRCEGERCPEYLCMEKMAWGRLILEWGSGLK